MPPIQVHRNSPIKAAKPSGTSPQTAEPGKAPASAPPPTTTTGTAGDASASPYQPAYPAAQPGNVPSLPAPTGAARLADQQPTPTTTLDASNQPPAPQPGAVPIAPGGSVSNSGGLPPPPKAGETLRQGPSQTSAMPPQMSYSLPDANAPQQHGSFTSTATGPAGYAAPGPTSLREGGASVGYGPSQPMGQQPGLSVGQQYHQQQQSSYRGGDDDAYGSQDESIWGTAKKWAAAAGEQLAHAESEVWKKINKD